MPAAELVHGLGRNYSDHVVLSMYRLRGRAPKIARHLHLDAKSKFSFLVVPQKKDSTENGPIKTRSARRAAQGFGGVHRLQSLIFVHF